MDSTTKTCKALLFGLETSLASALADVLKSCDCTAQGVEQGTERQRGDIVFCSPRADVLQQALGLYRNIPVVVVSRLPEMEDWLDALEAGAADYLAAPFEIIHLRWLLNAHGCTRSALAAA